MICSIQSIIRAQFHYVIDVAPTILEEARLNGVEQRPIEGVSSCTHSTTPKPRSGTRRNTSRCGETAAPVADRGDALQRIADRRPGSREGNPDIAGRSVLIQGNTQLLLPGVGRLSKNSVLNIENKSHAVTAEIEVPKTGAEGVIIAQGGNNGGWSLYAKNGKPKYCYKWSGCMTSISKPKALPAGEHQVRMEFAYAGAASAKADR